MTDIRNGNNMLCASGFCLAAGAALLTVTFAFHGARERHVADQMEAIAGAPQRWLVVHWIASVALSLLATAGLLVLSSGAARGMLMAFAWGAATMGAMWTLLTSLAEATAVTGSAIAGDAAAFTIWLAFAEGAANGFAAFALATTLIAANDLRLNNITPTLTSALGTASGVVSFTAWAAWSWLDFGLAAPIWIGSSILLCVWLCWFGLSLAFGSAGQIGRTVATNRPASKGA